MNSPAFSVSSFTSHFHLHPPSGSKSKLFNLFMKKKAPVKATLLLCGLMPVVTLVWLGIIAFIPFCIYLVSRVGTAVTDHLVK